MENQGEVLKILEEFKSGKESALDFIFSSYRNMVISLARRYFLLGAEQEDLIQEGMIGLYKACQTFSPSQNASFKSFAYLCIKRQMQTAIKTANRQKNILLNSALSLGSKNGIVFISAENADESQKIIYLPAFSDSPENQMINQETYDELLEQIQKSLSPFEYKILELYLDGYKTSQIATLTSSTYKAIDNALYRIKTKLQFLKPKN